MKRTWTSVAVMALASALAGCGSTSSTEVGVRTSMAGVFDKRGTQHLYAPGGVFVFLPVLNSWDTLSIAQQNLFMATNPDEGDRPVPDDLTFKTKDGNNVYIDVNVMWRIDPQKAPFLVSHVGRSVEEIKERVVRPLARSVIRDVFNEITSEEYYQVAVKNRVAEKARTALATQLGRFGLLVDMLQVQQHRFDQEYQTAINAQKQAEADVQTLIEQKKNMLEQKASELEAKRALWNRALEDAAGQAGRTRNEADAYYQTRTNEAKAIVAVAQAEAEGVRKEAQALGKLGGDAYVKMQVAQQLAKKHVTLVPVTNVSTMDVNKMMDYLLANKKKEATPKEKEDESQE